MWGRLRVADVDRSGYQRTDNNWKRKKLAILSPQNVITDRELLNSEYLSGCPLRHKLFSCYFYYSTTRKVYARVPPVHNCLQRQIIDFVAEFFLAKSISSGSLDWLILILSRRAVFTQFFVLNSSFVHISFQKPYFMGFPLPTEWISCIYRCNQL